MLRQYGIDYAQGYHVGRPVPLEEAGLVETGARGPAYA
jgi:EAL domain-containing protein (putative c-di-GMP-specific phosphodiesterase class I)